MRREMQVISAIVSASVGAAFVWAVLSLAAHERRPPVRCGAGLLAMGPRCCAPGQVEQGGRCTGKPVSCPAEMTTQRGGCVVSARRVSFLGGTVHAEAAEWEAIVRHEGRIGSVRPFRLDRFEVTFALWKQCEEAGVCDKIAQPEPGLPVTGVTVDQAKAFCRYAGGRLPTAAEWLFAAVGTEGRRFPWGDTGLVCRRAAFGLVDGPCATGGRGPDIAGSRFDGRTPAGVQDMSGNVAEWSVESDGTATARGGSFRSKLAGELTGLAAETGGASEHIGFRCAYSESR